MTAATTDRPFAVGSLVKPNSMVTSANFIGVYRVVKYNRTTVDITPVDGGRGVRVRPEHLLVATEDEVQNGPTFAPIPIPDAPLPLGAVVTVEHRKMDSDALYVVFGIMADGDRHKLVPLGGDADKPNTYWKIPRRMLTVVERDWSK